MSESASRAQLLEFAARIVAAHVAHNAVSAELLPGLINSVFGALGSVRNEVVVPEKPQPAVPVQRSIFPDYVVCLEDGKKFKTLKRHLKTSFGLTPQDYRERWGLPPEYPMVAPNYAAHRSAVAKQLGLGQKKAKAEPAKPQHAARKPKSNRREEGRY